jgi:GH15 family glucan-1,4-alpha-glucosidase
MDVGDYGIIGDGRSAALVSSAGSIDWLCWPRFDSPSLFGALLDPKAGRWQIAPRERTGVTRRYLPSTNVLETRLETPAGELLLTDAMSVCAEEDLRERMMPEHEIVRIAECVAGEVDVELWLVPRPSYGRHHPRIAVTPLGARIETPVGLLVLRSEFPLELIGDELRGVVRLRAGQSVCSSLVYAGECPAVLPPLGEWTRATVARSADWWRGWAARMRYDGPCRDVVERSALALKLLVNAPSGAVIAAPTTSLPERPGGNLNWDYRFCWLRDASMTTRALLELGYFAEAHAFASWLLHATRLTQPGLNVLYDVFGNSPPRERTLGWLAGFGGAQPVRIGNAAAKQLQLDIYGEVIEAATRIKPSHERYDHETSRLLCALGRFVSKHWREPDEGIWEPRSGRRCHTHSRLLSWVALDRLVSAAQRGQLRGAQLDEWARIRDQIRRELMERAWNPKINSYAATLDGSDLDASLLRLSWYGFENPRSERMQRTFARVEETLGVGDLLYRYKSGESPGEATFGICAFWRAEHLALGGGTVGEAQATFERLCGYTNDLGLFAEEIDARTGAPVGNFPQAFTHVGLIGSALTLAARLHKERHQRPSQVEVHP